MSGIRFNQTRYQHALVQYPFAPSLDRINAREGYVRANTRLVCVAANFAMNEWGIAVLTELAAGVRKNQNRKTPSEIATEWATLKRQTISEAEKAALGMSGPQLSKQRRRVAALKRAFTLGPAGLARAAQRAARTRRL